MKKLFSYRSVLAFVIALLPACLAVWPIFGSRFIPTHDGEYHIIRFWQFYTSLASGSWFPRWAPDLNLGYGIPLFTFQYPFPNYIGSLFHQYGLSYVDSVKWTLGFGYLVAIIFCYLWVRRIFDRIASVVATVTCAYVPYWFVDIYIRGSVGEVWAIAWVFAALYAIFTKRSLFIVITCMFLVISHNIMALIFIPILLIYAYIHNRLSVVDILLGVGAASYFWIPALYEQRFIVGISQVNIFDYFPRLDQLLIPSWGSGFRGQITGGNEMSYQIGILPIILFGWAGVMAIRIRKATLPKEIRFALVVFAAALFLMTPWSVWIWKLVPFAHFVQYPWRLLSIVVIMIPILAGYIASRFRFGWMIALIAMILTFGYSRPVTYEPRTDEYYLNQSSFTQGTNSMGNAFQTKWFALESDSRPDFSMSSGTVSAERIHVTAYHVTLSSTQGGILTSPIAYYPGWLLDIGKTDIPGNTDVQGRLTFGISKGQHEGIVRLGLTPWQMIAISVSILSLSVAVVSFILRKYYVG